MYEGWGECFPHSVWCGLEKEVHISSVVCERDKKKKMSFILQYSAAPLGGGGRKSERHTAKGKDESEWHCECVCVRD